MQLVCIMWPHSCIERGLSAEKEDKQIGHLCPGDTLVSMGMGGGMISSSMTQSLHCALETFIASLSFFMMYLNLEI